MLPVIWTESQENRCFNVHLHTFQKQRGHKHFIACIFMNWVYWLATATRTCSCPAAQWLSDGCSVPVSGFEFDHLRQWRNTKPAHENIGSMCNQNNFRPRGRPINSVLLCLQDIKYDINQRV